MARYVRDSTVLYGTACQYLCSIHLLCFCSTVCISTVLYSTVLHSTVLMQYYTASEYMCAWEEELTWQLRRKRTVAGTSMLPWLPSMEQMAAAGEHKQGERVSKEFIFFLFFGSVWPCAHQQEANGSCSEHMGDTLAFQL